MKKIATATLALGLVASSAGCFRAFDNDRDGASTGDGLAFGLNALVEMSVVEAGSECPQGGVRIDSGVDRNQSGTLDDEDGELETTFLCRGADGADGASTRVTVGEAAGDACSSDNGVTIVTWIDTDGDGTVSGGEAPVENTVCGPATEEFDIVSSDASVEVCPDGGVVLSAVYADAEGANAALYAITLCAPAPGAVGATGPDGANARVTEVSVVQDGGRQCREASAFLDLDGDGQLAGEEELATARTLKICNGQDGNTSATGVPPEGLSEGTTSSPVDLEVGDLDGALALHNATVAANGTSVYRFTALEEVGAPGTPVAPYTVAISSFESDVSVTLSPEDDPGSESTLGCRFRTPSLKLCSTPALVGGKRYLLSVSELNNVPNAFGLTVSFASDLGTRLHPAVFEALCAPVAGGCEAIGTSVSAGGESHLELTAPGDGLFSIVFDDLAGAPNGDAPYVAWSLYPADSLLEEDLLFRCESPAPGEPASCPTPKLIGGELYRLVVEEAANAGGVFTLGLHEGDLFTPVLELNTVYALTLPEENAVYRFVSNGEGAYTTLSDPLSHAVFADVGAIFHGVRFDPCQSRGCTINNVEAGTSYYLRFQAAVGSDVMAYIADVGGPDGEGGAAPIPVTEGATSIGTISGGEYGGYSYYQFTGTGETSRYTFRIDPPWPTDAVSSFISCEGYSAPPPDFASRVMGQFHGPSPLGCITEPLADGESIYFRFKRSWSAVYDLTTERGDTLTEVWPVDGPPAVVTTDNPNLEVIYRFRVDEAGPIQLAFTGATQDLKRRLFSGHPNNRGSTGYLRRCEASNNTFSANDCYLESVLIPDVDYYLWFDNRTTGTNEQLVEVRNAPITDVTPGATLADQVLADRDRNNWYRFDAAASGIYSVTLDFLSNADYRVALFDAAFQQVNESSSYTATAGGSRTINLSGSALAVGTWYVRVRPGLVAPDPDLEYSITVNAP